MAQQLGTNTFTTAKWIVSPTASDGTHTTLQAAHDAASANDIIFVRPGSYAGVTVTKDISFTNYDTMLRGDANPNTNSVIVNGKITIATDNIDVCFSGFKHITNSANIVEITSSNASINFKNGFFSVTSGQTGLALNTGSSSNIWCHDCFAQCENTAILFAISGSANDIFIYNGFFGDVVSGSPGTCTISNTGAVGHIWIRDSTFLFPISTANLGTIAAYNSSFGSLYNPGTINTTWLTTAGTVANHYLENCDFYSGTASAVSIGSGTTIEMQKCNVYSSNTNAITGAGTLIYSALSFLSGGSIVINPTGQTTTAFRQGKPPFEEITGTSQTATPGGHYIANNAGLVTITLPATFAVGDIVWVVGKGAGLWRLTASSGDTIHFGNQDSTSGGSLTATNRYDAVQVVGTVANAEWTVSGISQGNLTVA